jgi:hypothetical protein
MGADLYISQLFDSQFQKWHKRFDKAIAGRGGLPENSPERAQAQKRAEHCFDKIYEQEYFRDSYNDSSVLWKFGLSLWEDVIPMLSKG